MDREYRGERDGYAYSLIGEQRARGPKKQFRFLAIIRKDEGVVHEYESEPSFSDLGEAVRAGERYTFEWIDSN